MKDIRDAVLQRSGWLETTTYPRSWCKHSRIFFVRHRGFFLSSGFIRPFTVFQLFFKLPRRSDQHTVYGSLHIVVRDTVGANSLIAWWDRRRSKGTDTVMTCSIIIEVAFSGWCSLQRNLFSVSAGRALARARSGTSRHWRPSAASSSPGPSATFLWSPSSYRFFRI